MDRCPYNKNDHRAVKSMEQKLVTKPVVTAVSLADIKEHLRIESSDTDHDARLAPYLATAIDQVEKQTGRALITQTWDFVFYSWGELFFPLGNLQSVVSFAYQDKNGATQIMSTSDYLVDGIGTDRGRIVLDPDFDYPTLWKSDPITIRVICGYGDAATDIPGTIQAAIKLLVEELDTGVDMQPTIDRLLNPNRLYSL